MLWILKYVTIVSRLNLKTHGICCWAPGTINTRPYHEIQTFDSHDFIKSQNLLLFYIWPLQRYNGHRYPIKVTITILPTCTKRPLLIPDVYCEELVLFRTWHHLTGVCWLMRPQLQTVRSYTVSWLNPVWLKTT